MAACGSRQDSDLFQPQEIMSGQGSAGQGGAGGDVGAGGSGGTLSIAGSAGQTTGGAGSGGIGGSDVQPNGGSSGSAGEGGSAGSEGGSGGAAPDCQDVGGVGFAETGHCYVVHDEPLDWADARDHCAEEGANLVTIGSEGENDFVWSLLEDRQWLGATDGREPTAPGAGEYAWVSGEPMSYVNFTPGQPSAVQQQCPPSGPGPQPQICYEHCAYQWDPEGDDNAGEWNDQGCWELEAFVCEHG
jgi:Lectin C-type domain